MSRPEAAYPEALVSIAARVEERILVLLDAELARWRAVDPLLEAPLVALRDFIAAGGKRLRPAFCYSAYVGAGGDPESSTIVDAAAALEVVHTFALVHDDVMDGSELRRGRDAIHRQFMRAHQDEHGRGEARRFGEGMAILVGDLAFVYADQLMEGANAAAWRIWNELRIELNVGQLLDIVGSVRNDRRREKAERICRYKSGKYTIERPLHLGAVLAAPPREPELLPALSEYGLPLGDAFQMRDDVMGAFGDPAITGKPVGGDLREGKPTPLMAMATESATPAQAEVLALVGRADLGDDDVAAVQQAIETKAAEAVAALDDIDLTEAARTELAALAEFVVLRAT